MNTKEAIKFDYINFLKSFKELVTREFCNPPGIRDVNKRIDEIIALLKRGKKFEKREIISELFVDEQGEALKAENVELKKYRQIVEEIKYELNWHRPEEQLFTAKLEVSKDEEYLNEILDMIDNIEQKYFPKEAKRGSYFYECTSEEIYHLKKIPFKEAKE